jgi:hypothetical protein
MLNDFSLKPVSEWKSSQGNSPQAPSSLRSYCAIVIAFGGVLLNLALIIWLGSLAAYESEALVAQIILKHRATPNLSPCFSTVNEGAAQKSR